MLVSVFPENADLVDPVDTYLPAAVQDLPVAKHYSRMDNAPFRILEKGKVSENGL